MNIKMCDICTFLKKKKKGVTVINISHYSIELDIDDGLNLLRVGANKCVNAYLKKSKDKIINA